MRRCCALIRAVVVRRNRRAWRAGAPWLLVLALALNACAPALPPSPGPGVPTSSALSLPPRPDGRPADAAKASAIEGFGHFPLYFVENQGQTDEQVGYYVSSHGLALYFTPGGLTYGVVGPSGSAPIPVPDDPRAQSCADPHSKRAPLLNCPTTPLGRWTVKVDFVGADQGVRPEGVEKTEAIFSYFKGPESKWKTGLPSYAGVAYRDLWPGIDLVYGGADGHLKYSFVVQPGGDPSRIKLDYRGATDVRLTEEGGLDVETPLGGFTDQKPYSYQEIDGRQVGIPSSFSLEADPEVGAFVSGFRVGAYDPSLPLVVDPVVLGYAGFIGSSKYDSADGVAVDSSGHAYVTGTTQSPTSFPLVTGPDTSYNGGFNDIFVSKVNAAGTGLDYSGFIGGDGEDYVGGIAVDSNNRAIVGGFSHSTGASFPSKVGPRTTRPNSPSAGASGFVLRVNAAGNGLDYAGWVGGDGFSGVDAVAVDNGGNAYVAGQVTSPGSSFPAKVGPDLTYAGGQGYNDPLDPSFSLPGSDAFVAKVNASGTDFAYAGYIGTTANDQAAGIAVDSTGAAYVTGLVAVDDTRFHVSDMSFYCINGPSCTAHSTGEGFVVKVRSDGTGFSYAGYLGITTNGSNPYGIAVDGSGFAYVVGRVDSAAAGDAFLAKVAQDGSAIVNFGFISGPSPDTASSVAVDSGGAVYVAGYTYSDSLTPAPRGGPDVTFNGDLDAFVAKYNADGTVAYLGYIGGPAEEAARSVAVDSSGNAYVVGGFNPYSDPPSFPATVGPDTSANGNYDAWIAKAVVSPPPEVRVGVISVSEGDAGSGPAAMEVTLSSAASEIVTVHYQTGAAGASGGTSCSAGVDFVNVSGTLTYQPGETTKTVQVPICGDTTVEPNEQISFTLSSPTNAVLQASPGIITITNDDQAPSSLSIADVRVGEGNSGSANATFKVSLSPASNQTVTVSYATASGSATGGTCPGADFQSVSSGLSFPAGITQQTIQVPVCGDASVEPDETFTVSLFGASNATISQATATGTIVNDDATQATVSISDAGNPEAPGGIMVFTPSLSAPVNATVTVSYQTSDGTAVGGGGCGGGADYVTTFGTFSFAPNQTTTNTVVINTCDDDTPEYGETFYLNLTGVTTGNAAIGDSYGVGLIQDVGDAQPSIGINDVTFTEGNSGVTQYTFDVFLSKASGQPISVNYTTADGTAAAGSDYTAVSGTVTWQPGEFTKHVTVLVNGDIDIEGDETFTVNLSGQTFASIADNQATGTIQNDDTPPSLSISGATVTETNQGQTGLGLTVALSAPSTQTVGVNYATSNGTATGGTACTAGVDYLSTNGALSFEPGTTIKTVPVIVCGDISFESDETFAVSLSGASNASIGTASGTATIANDDQQTQAVPTLSVADVSVAEGSAGTTNASFAVTLSAATSGTVTVQYATANGTATAGTCGSGGADFQAASGTLTFTAGQTSKTVPVVVCGDTTSEANETFTLTLSSPSGATLADATATGTITNDDEAGGPSCAPRPNPTMTVTHVPGVPGRLQVVVNAVSNGQAPSNALQQIQFGAASNALVEVPGTDGGRAGSFNLPVGAASTTFFVQRQAAGPFKVDFVIVDACNSISGPWHTFVGGGSAVP